MRSFYWDIFLMMLTYGIMTYLSIRLMKRRKRNNSGNNDNGGHQKPEKPILPDLPQGVVWPKDVEDKELVL